MSLGFTFSIPKQHLDLALLPIGHCQFAKGVVSESLRFVYSHDLDLAISLSDAISIEILQSFQIATAGDSDNV
jgi:hypothetical protein